VTSAKADCRYHQFGLFFCVCAEKLGMLQTVSHRAEVVIGFLEYNVVGKKDGKQRV
jgi:hypothetical protein